MKISGLYSISAAGLSAQRKRIEIVAENIANVDNPQYIYKKIQQSISPFSQQLKNKMACTSTEVVSCPDCVKLIYDPAHPAANDQGYVQLPDINTVSEMTTLMKAMRAYEANLAALNAAKEMDKKALDV